VGVGVGMGMGVGGVVGLGEGCLPVCVRGVCIYINTCIYCIHGFSRVCMCIYVKIYVYIFKNICVHMYIFIYTYIYIDI